MLDAAGTTWHHFEKPPAGSEPAERMPINFSVGAPCSTAFVTTCSRMPVGKWQVTPWAGLECPWAMRMILNHHVAVGA